MNRTHLKIIAILSMLIDHTGAILFPELIVLRMIGRLAFPIFAYLLVEGYFHTRDVKKYLIRLGAFALISEVPFDLALFGKAFYFGYQNIFFTLCLALLGIWMLEVFKERNPMAGNLIFAGLCLASIVLRTDYSIIGMLTMFLFYYYRNQKAKALYNVGMLHFIVGLLSAGFLTGTFNIQGMLQSLAALSMVLIWFYNGQKGRSLKYFFYAFYPVHLTVLWLLSLQFKG